MKKCVLICIWLLFLSAYAKDSFMDKCIQSWVGYPLKSVIKEWGYPNQEKKTPEKKLFVWENYDTNYGYHENMNYFYANKMSHENFFPYGSVLEVDYCRKILEADDNDIIIGGRWEGNDCPKFYKFGKKFVNPENDKWQKGKKL